MYRSNDVVQVSENFIYVRPFPMLPKLPMLSPWVTPGTPDMPRFLKVFFPAFWLFFWVKCAE